MTGTGTRVCAGRADIYVTTRLWGTEDKGTASGQQNWGRVSTQTPAPHCRHTHPRETPTAATGTCPAACGSEDKRNLQMQSGVTGAGEHWFSVSVPSPWPQVTPLNSTRVRLAGKFTFWGALWKDNSSFGIPGFLPGGSVDPVSSCAWAWCEGGGAQGKKEQCVPVPGSICSSQHTISTRS